MVVSVPTNVICQNSNLNLEFLKSDLGAKIKTQTKILLEYGVCDFEQFFLYYYV